MKKIGCLVIFIALGYFAYVTNPSKEKHIENAIRILKECGVENFGINSDYLTIGEGLVGKEGMADFMTRFIERDSYLVFSLTKVEIAGQQQTIAIGLFGHLFDISDLTDLKELDIVRDIKEMIE